MHSSAGSPTENTNRTGEIPFSVRRSRRARRLRLTVYRNGEVTVSAPNIFPYFLIEKFVKEKKEWISRKREYFLSRPMSDRDKLLRLRNKSHFLAFKEAAMRLVRDRIDHFNRNGDFQFKSITIRNQRARWGSCSRRGNLNFNYKIVFLTPSEQDYVIIHELCHLKEFNHSESFWKLVSCYMFDYDEIRRRLRQA